MSLQGSEQKTGFKRFSRLESFTSGPREKTMTGFTLDENLSGRRGGLGKKRSIDEKEG
jgi:hypothetical protein